jgi:hypothetical protein
MRKLKSLVRQVLAIEMLEYEDVNHLSGSNESRCRKKIELLEDVNNVIDTTLNQQKGCKHCTNYTEKYKEMGDKNAWFSLYEHYMEVVDDRKDGSGLSFKIKYCPICGRNLGDGK